MDCKHCGSANRPRARYCGACGAEMLAGCRHCGAVLPPEAAACPACGGTISPATNAPEELNRGATVHERRLVTVLFADFEGFTAFSDQRDPEEVHDYMGSLWSRITPLIEAQGGSLEKYIGDALVALFGVKQAQEDSPAHAIRAALAVQASLRDLALRGQQKPLPMRIAINTGPVVIQPVGREGEFRATGETLNVASRLQSHAPSGGVLISHDTFRHVEGLFEMHACAPISVKGKTEPIRAYVVARARPRQEAQHVRGVAGVKTELIGRMLELNQLQEILRRVSERREPEVVTLVAEAGLGKTRLVHEFQQWAQSLPGGVQLFSGRATAEMRGSSFALMRDLLAARFDIQDTDTLMIARTKLESGVASFMPQGGPAETAETRTPKVAHFIGQLLRLDFSQSPHLQGLLHDPEQMRQRAFHCAGQFFAAVTQPPGTPPGQPAPPTLVILDDLQWSDDGSLDLLLHIARACPGAPLLIVCLARPALDERRPDWGDRFSHHTRMQLGPLRPVDSREMVQQVLCKAAEIPAQLLERVVVLAEGNPFYVEEALKMFIEQGAIIPGPDHWEVEPQRLAETMLPATLTGVLQARLDSLSNQERELAQRASVVGRIFWNTALAPLNPVGESGPGQPATGASALTRKEIGGALDSLVAKQIIVRRPTSSMLGATEFAFTHELFRNVAYETVLKKRRRQLHGQVADWLMAAAGDRVGETAALVGGHLEKGENPQAAADWYARAGREATASHTPEIAAELYTRALGLLPPDGTEAAAFRPRRLDWHLALAECLGALARFPEAIAHAEEVRRLGEVLLDGIAQARAWNALSFLRERQGANRDAIAAADQALALAQAAGGAEEQIKALHLKGWAYYRLADAPAVLALAGRTEALCRQSGDNAGLARSFKLHGVAHLQLGHFREADDYFQRGREIWESTGDLRNAASMWSNRGETARARGDYAAAVDLYQQALAMARQIGARESELIYRTNLAGAWLGLNQLPAAELDLRQVVAEANTGRSFLAETHSLLAEACLKQGKVAEALTFAGKALQLAQAAESALELAGAWRICGQASAAAPAGPPRAHDPATCFAEALRLFDQIGAEGERARTLRLVAELDRQAGALAAAKAKLGEADAIFQRLGMLA